MSKIIMSEEEKALLQALFQDPNAVEKIHEFQTVVQGITPAQFIENDHYLGKAGSSLWPKNKELFIEVAEDKRICILVLTGSIGWGKGYLASVLYSWYLFNFMRYNIPQLLCGLAAASPMYGMITSVTATHAKKSFYKEIRSMLQASSFFTDVVPYENRVASEIVFRNQRHGEISVMPSAPDALNDIGLNLFLVLIDEWAFMENITDSKRAEPGQKVYDQARRLFENLDRRIRNRTNVGGEIMGKVMLVSSANYEGDIVDQFAKERANDPTVKILDKTEIEQKPGLKQQASFYCFVGDVKAKMPPRCFDDPAEKDQYPEDMVKKVPNTYRSTFESNIYAAIRDILGLRTSISAHLFPDKSLIDDVFDGRKSFYPPLSDLNDPKIVAQNMLPFLDMMSYYSAHFDLAKNKCLAGFALSRVIGLTKAEDNKDVNDLPANRVICSTDVAISIDKDPLLGEISIPKTEELLMELMNLGVRVISVSWDGFQSQGSRQRFEQLIKHTNIVRIDANKEVYYNLLRLVTSKRWKSVHNPTLETEVKDLLDLPGSKHIDKGKCGSKDLSDAVACSLYSICMLAEEFAPVLFDGLDFFQVGQYNDLDESLGKSEQVSGGRLTTIKPW